MSTVDQLMCRMKDHECAAGKFWIYTEDSMHREANFSCNECGLSLRISVVAFMGSKEYRDLFGTKSRTRETLRSLNAPDGVLYVRETKEMMQWQLLLSTLRY